MTTNHYNEKLRTKLRKIKDEIRLRTAVERAVDEGNLKKITRGALRAQSSGTQAEKDVEELCPGRG